MQLMETEQTLTKAFESNKTRAQNFFGNGEMYLERYIADAHHIEIRLLADTHGNTVYGSVNVRYSAEIKSNRRSTFTIFR